MIDKFSTVWLAVTYDCNNRCRWCYASCNISDYRDKVMKEENEDKFVGFLKELEVKNVRLIGGEPTIYPRIVGLTKKLTDAGIRKSIVTNGRRFSDVDFARDMQKAGIDYVGFSVEGYDAETHDWGTCVKGSYDETMEGIRTCKKLGINVSTNTIFREGLLDDKSLEKLVDSLRDVEILTFNICGPCLSTNSNAQHSITPYEGAKAFEKVYPLVKRKGKKVVLVTPTAVCGISEDLREEMKKDKAISGRCQTVVGSNFIIEYNGNILPCTHFSDYPMFNLFDKNRKIMTKNEFISVWNDEQGVPAKFREKIRHFPSKKCSSCEEICTGGCPLFWTKYDPDEVISR